MEKELLSFIREHDLSPFNKTKTPVRAPATSIFKTKDAKAVYAKVLSGIASNFNFADTATMLHSFPTTTNADEIAKRQAFFRSVGTGKNNSFLTGVELTRATWKPPYSIIVVTEDDKTFVELQKRGCPTKLLLNERDVLELEDADIVQVIDCEQYGRALERLPQTVFLGSIDEAYLERHVALLSRWKEILTVLSEQTLDEQTQELLKKITELMPLLATKSNDTITREQVEEALDEIKEEISASVTKMTVSGNSLMEVISKGLIPEELKRVVNQAIGKTGLPRELFTQAIPVQIDEVELEKTLRKQSITQFTSIAETIKMKATAVSSLPEQLRLLEERLLVYDFQAGVSKWMAGRDAFPQINESLSLKETNNLFLTNPQPITFHLTKEHRCSILTGANSGGKTTLLEHILQTISCLQLGLPFAGTISCPLFSEVYYFAKNKGSMSKGAFETLLTQMSEITPGDKTLILADEIEAVTEPGVAGKMISATAQYFIQNGCFLVIATHLGHEIQKNIPPLARIDGIEARGLSADNELIVDHNPLLGKLAHSTPELIIEKMVKTHGGDYFSFLHSSLQKKQHAPATPELERRFAHNG